MIETEESALSERPTAHSRFPLVDRNQFLQEFESIFSSSVPSHSGCLSIEGGWGMGRTALLNAACLTAESSGCLVLRARGGNLERDAPFGALLRIIEGIASLRNANEEVREHIEKVLGYIHHEGERNFPALGAAFYALLCAVRSLAPVLLAIDDADLVDDATMTTLEYVYHRIDDQQIWLLTTSPPRRPGAGPLAIEHLLVNQHVRHFQLQPLTLEGVHHILKNQLNQEPDKDFTEAVLEGTSGRPEFVLELAKACREERLAPVSASISELSPLAIPRISQKVLVRVNRLASAAKDLLESCAIYGEGSDLASVGHLSGIDPDSADRAVDSLVHAELLRPGRPLDFVAPIIRWALLQDIPSARRSQLHSRCADFLVQIGADESEVVGHLLATEPSWNMELAAKLAVAGRNLLDEGDVRLAAKCLRRSLNESPATLQEPSLWLDLAQCEIELGLRTSLTSFQKALTLGILDDESVIQVAVNLMHSLREWPELRAEGVATLQKVTSRLSAVEESLQLEFELGLTVLAGHPAQRSYGVSRIETLVASTDERSKASRAARIFLDLHRFESDSSVSAANIVEILGSVLDSDQMMVGDLASEAILARACRMLLSADEFVRVDLILEMARWRARSLGDVAGEDDALRLVVLSKLWQGSLVEAEEACRRHDELGDTISMRHMVGAADLLIAQGRTDEALLRFGSTELERFDDPLDRATAHVERGRLFAAVSRTEEALDEFRRASATAERAGINNEVLVSWRPPTAHALASLGRWDEAKNLATDHLAAARAFGARRNLGTALRAVAASTQNLEERISWLIESVKVLENSSARLETAGAMVDLGAALVDNRDMEGARILLQQGATIASACKADRLVEIAGSHLRSAGARPRRLGSTGVDSLTPAELRAVHMAANNVTNRAIADELFVNVKTIEGHLSRAYRKLGVTSRFELAELLNESRSVDDSNFEDISVATPVWSEDR